MEFTKIVGTGYSCEDLIFLHEEVVSMWDSKPQDAITAYRNGIMLIFKIWVKVDSTSWKTILITEENINDNIRNLISEKYKGLNPSNK